MEFVPNELHRLRVGVATTVGSVRPHNEDNFYVPGREAVGGTLSELDASYDFSIHEADGNLFIVADGMGGQLAGEKASQMAVEIIPQEVRKRLSASEERVGSVSHAIRDAVATANQEILGLSLIQPEFSNMGTTVVLAYFLERHVYIAGIGDSRVYRLRDGKLTQLTKDHSLADALLEAGTITEEELPNHRFKHVLYLYLGSKDARSGPQDVRDEEIRVGDRYLLSSDGLTGYVGDDQLARMLQEIDDPREAARRLVSTALDHYSKDNITCMVIHAV
ncbi:MAG: protein phosphatase 2C domain-containing protein [Isosphaeraceae bacterium]|nr:protein phosphatase 2C domain-containing protein [Isosphaeraceae bacterium]